MAAHSNETQALSSDLFIFVLFYQKASLLYDTVIRQTAVTTNFKNGSTIISITTLSRMTFSMTIIRNTTFSITVNKMRNDTKALTLLCCVIYTEFRK
jgi:hypothetical protein